MKNLNIFKIIKIVLAVLTAGKAIHDEVKPVKKLSSGASEDLGESDNTDPQNPNYPPKK